MIRSKLVDAVSAENTRLSLPQVERLVATFFDTIIAQMAKGGRVEIRGFGTFETRQRVARPGLNPRTGEAVSVDAKCVPHFKPAKKLRHSVAKTIA